MSSTQPPNQEALKDKIRKLLALSHSPNEHEARRALAKAQELMLRFNLSVSEQARPDIHFKRIRFWTGRILSMEARYIAEISEQYCCETTSDYYERQFYLSIFGTESDVEICIQAIEYAYKTFCSCFRSYWRQVSYSKAQKAKRRPDSRKDYCRGFVSGLINAMKAHTQEQGLVAVVQEDVKAAAKEHKDKLLASFGITIRPDDMPAPVIKPKSKKAKAPYHLDKDAYRHGMESGLHVTQKDQLTIIL